MGDDQGTERQQAEGQQVITDLQNMMAHPDFHDPDRLTRDVNTQLHRLQSSRRVRRCEREGGTWWAHMDDGQRIKVSDLLKSAARPKTP